MPVGIAGGGHGKRKKIGRKRGTMTRQGNHKPGPIANLFCFSGFRESILSNAS